MKRWIAKQWIAMAEVFGWSVPGWVRRLLPATEIDELFARERDLTDALKSDEPRAFPVPAFLEQRIERAVVEPEEEPQTGPRWIDLLIPSSAFAMAVIVGFVLLSGPKAEEVGDIPEAGPEVAVTEPVSVPAAPESSRTLDRIGQGLSTLEQGLILQPLAAEQKRLTADVAGALKFVSNSILPDTYASGVNSRLDSLKEEVAKSI